MLLVLLDMKLFTLYRVASGPNGCLGVMVHDNEPLCVTLEATYVNDAGEWYTKIPQGSHVAQRAMFNKGGYETYEIFVPGHDELKIHIGNYRRQTDGCILVGERFGDLEIRSKPWIQHSASAFWRFMGLANKAEVIKLVIVDSYRKP